MQDENTPDVKITLDDLDHTSQSLPRADPLAALSRYEVALERIKVLSDENASLKDDLRELKARGNTHEILDSLIWPFAKGAFTFMCVYCAAVFGILIADGTTLQAEWGDEFDIKDTTLNVLLGSTAVSVIGLVGTVLTGVFFGARGKNGG